MKRARLLLQAVVLAMALAMVFWPALRSTPAAPVFVLLYYAAAADMFRRGWRSGHLQQTFGQLRQAPPRTPPIETLVGTIAVLLVL